MSLGPFHTSQPGYIQDSVSSYFFNKSLAQRGLEFRLGEYTDDLREEYRNVGKALISAQERAAGRYEKSATAIRGEIRSQSRELVRSREDAARNAELLRATLLDSSSALRSEIQATTRAVERVGGILASQLTHVAWLLAEQNQTLHAIFELLREGRSNECRQLVEQGERHLRAGYFREAEERFRLALSYDSTDHLTHQNLGLVSVQLGSLDTALDHFLKALAFPPKTRHGRTEFFTARAATHAARVFYAQGQYGDAAAYLERALRDDPKNAKNWYDLAVMRVSLRNTDGAIAALGSAIDLEPLFAAQAISDNELVPALPAIEALIVRKTGEAFADLDRSIAALEERDRRAAALAATYHVTIAPAAGIDAIRATAVQRGTLYAAREAMRQVNDAANELQVRTTAAGREAREHAYQDGQAEALDAERRYRATDTHAQARLREADDRVTHAMDPFLAAFIWAIIGGVVGAILGLAAHSLLVFLALLVGAPIVAVIVVNVGRSAAERARDEIQRSRTVGPDIQAMRGRIEDRMKAIDAAFRAV